MGPCWLALRQPRRVAPEAQVRPRLPFPLPSGPCSSLALYWKPARRCSPTQPKSPPRHTHGAAGVLVQARGGARLAQGSRPRLRRRRQQVRRPASAWPPRHSVRIHALARARTHSHTHAAHLPPPRAAAQHKRTSHTTRACCLCVPPVTPRRDAPPLSVASINIKTLVNPGTSANEVVAVSVVYLPSVRTDGPVPQEEWNNARHLRHFSAVRKLNGGVFPAGEFPLVAASSEQGMSDRACPAELVPAVQKPCASFFVSSFFPLPVHTPGLLCAVRPPVLASFPHSPAAPCRL